MANDGAAPVPPPPRHVLTPPPPQLVGGSGGTTNSVTPGLLAAPQRHAMGFGSPPPPILLNSSSFMGASAGLMPPPAPALPPQQSPQPQSQQALLQSPQQPLLQQSPVQMQQQQHPPQEQLPPNRTLYVNNLSCKIKPVKLKRELRAMFENFGEVRDIIAMSSFWRRGQAFVIFGDQNAATRAKDALQFFPYNGKEMRINYARTLSDVFAKEEGSFTERPPGPKKPRAIVEREKQLQRQLLQFHHLVTQHTQQIQQHQQMGKNATLAPFMGSRPAVDMPMHQRAAPYENGAMFGGHTPTRRGGMAPMRGGSGPHGYRSGPYLHHNTSSNQFTGGNNMLNATSHHMSAGPGPRSINPTRAPLVSTGPSNWNPESRLSGDYSSPAAGANVDKNYLVAAAAAQAAERVARRRRGVMDGVP